MRILYGVTGEGLGHAMRARVLLQHLNASGHEVKVAASGRAAALLRRDHADVVVIDGLSICYRKGAVERVLTVSTNLRRAPAALARNARVALDEVLVFDPQVIVSDFDSFSYAVGRALRRPIVSFDHQHIVARCRHPRAVLRRVSYDFELTRTLVAKKMPRCDRYVCTSFFFPDVRRACTSTTRLVGPVVRPELAALSPHRGEHVLVYQTAAGDRALLGALRAVRGVPFRVYGAGPAGRLGNVELVAFDERRFLDDLAGARAVISNGGFTTLSEAVYLGKPVLSIPVRHQGEQELNAAWLAHSGLGVLARRPSPRRVRDFLAFADRYIGRADPRVVSGRADAKRALDEALAEVA